ncbi:MAG: P27 family phage terminase small subunit [Clostridiales bacterium]|nr:P27 family phage terminase small subunit [Clostridiales bacterium]
MDSKQWKKKIKKATETVGTYQESFDEVINTLADLLAERDRVYDKYIEEGAEPLVLVTSDRGQENMRDNPLLTTWRSINRDVLQYWRDLGLTPAGLKKIMDDSMKQPEASALDKVLEKLEGKK